MGGVKEKENEKEKAPAMPADSPTTKTSTALSKGHSSAAAIVWCGGWVGSVDCWFSCWIWYEAAAAKSHWDA